MSLFFSPTTVLGTFDKWVELNLTTRVLSLHLFFSSSSSQPTLPTILYETTTEWPREFIFPLPAIGNQSNWATPNWKPTTTFLRCGEGWDQEIISLYNPLLWVLSSSFYIFFFFFARVRKALIVWFKKPKYMVLLLR